MRLGVPGGRDFTLDSVSSLRQWKHFCSTASPTAELTKAKDLRKTFGAAVPRQDLLFEDFERLSRGKDLEERQEYRSVPASRSPSQV